MMDHTSLLIVQDNHYATHLVYMLPDTSEESIVSSHPCIIYFVK